MMCVAIGLGSAVPLLVSGTKEKVQLPSLWVCSVFSAGRVTAALT